MGHISSSELEKQLQTAREKIEIGALYRHIKSGGEYIVQDIVLYEPTESPIVIYRAEYGNKLTWARDIDLFVEKFKKMKKERK